MEIFLDGGLFEILIALLFAVSLNFIFVKKYALIAFSICILVAPVLLFFIHQHTLYYVLVSWTIFNAVFLVILLWKEKRENPSRTLFDVEKIKIQLDQVKENLKKIRSRKKTS